MLKRIWRRHGHWILPLVIVVVVLGAGALSAVVMRALLSAVGFALNLGMMAAFMIVQVVFYFGFIFYYLGGVKTVKVMPGQAGEVTLEDDYWGQPELVKVARQWVSLLEDPARLRQMGGQPVTGVLLSGPPGSGKTHLARCMAGTAAVPFLGLDGSRLISMWLGVGSIKVMRLFANARRYAKRFGACIVFVDELDSVGSSRGGVTGGQTQAGMFGGMPMWGAGAGVINTLLAQLDGINEQRGGLRSRWYKWRGRKLPPPDYVVFVMGATNRPDVLDPALVRAGRLDVKIRVDPTDKAGRIEIIRGYLASIKCAEEINVEAFGADTAELTPADLKTIVVRRAPAFALFDGREGITNADLRRSLAEQSMGLRQPISGLREEDKRLTAYHEAGHAIATWALTDDKITRVTIVRYGGGPSGGASLGHVEPVPEQERWHWSMADIENKICVGLAGRAAQLEFLGGPYLGVGADLKGVRRMLLRLAEEGYFSSLGYKQELTDALTEEMDELVARLMTKTRETLREHADKVEKLVAVLVERDELNEEEVAEILGPRPARAVVREREPAREPTGESLPQA